ncbi:MAG: helix-turn-helix domain-containing protein [Ruminococcaceae bacterium]|nr:helix-turn-helix domain-containing protein [Oscillospiraceae bacterium]
MELGRKIRQLRFKAGLTQEQLAEKMGIVPQSVSKWENAAAMPDITALPRLAEIFGVSIDDLFDLTAEQRLNRIENRLDIESELPGDLFREYEDFLNSLLADGEYRKRATELLAYLFWHRMNADSEKVRRYAKEAIRRAPGEKCCQWMLQKAAGHAAWDWNIANHSKAVEFYRGLAEENPSEKLPLTYLLDNLLADRRADEAEAALEKYAALPDVNPVHVGVYRAHIALARFDEKGADSIMEELGEKYPDDFVYLFEAAQYYAGKCDYDRAIGLYERAFALEPRRPRFQDELMAISDLYAIRGDYGKAAETYGRIVDLLTDEWGFTEEVELKEARKEKARLEELARKGGRS